MRNFMTVLAAATAAMVTATPTFAAVHWVASPYQPPDALAAGWENGGALYLCQAPYGPAVYPGKVVAGRCNVGYGGVEYPIADFRWAIGHGLWAQPGEQRPPVIGGYENGQPLLVCKAHYFDSSGGDHGWHPGKVVAARCNITWGGAEIPMQTYRELYQ
jgi:hypothetical protein